MNDQFGLVVIVIVVIILVGGFVFVTWGRRPRSPRATDATAREEQDQHGNRREDP